MKNRSRSGRFLLSLSCHLQSLCCTHGVEGKPQLLLLVFLLSHSLTFFCTESPGAQGIPEFVSVGLVDEVQIVDCNNIRGLEVHKDWIKFFKDDPQHVEWYASQCLNNHHFFKANIESLRQRLNQTEGVHIMQRMCGCEWDDETGELNGFNQFGYDAEDFIALDLQTLTWIAPKPQALITKLSWDTEKARLEANKYILGHECPKYLKKYVQYGKNLLESAVLPSVSLLQKSPSSPISCHATGFYPHRAVMFWRKDGEEIHEGVDHGEILPNNDGTFQMSVDLKLSSVTPADWERYDCVFQLSDVSSDIITKLDKAVIRTNMVLLPLVSSVLLASPVLPPVSTSIINPPVYLSTVFPVPVVASSSSSSYVLLLCVLFCL
uniref:Ig-like domain-containing protein n=1 Tax=Amphilophus citrinellus TaxID=61819 RepID=A0A3Q0T8H0_AMPCI